MMEKLFCTNMLNTENKVMFDKELFSYYIVALRIAFFNSIMKAL